MSLDATGKLAELLLTVAGTPAELSLFFIIISFFFDD